MFEWEFPINPVAASRPRVSRHGAYFTGPYKKFKVDCAEVVFDILGEDFKMISSPVHVDLELYVTRPKTTKLIQPKADIDNYIKAVFDVMNGKLWVDDTQVRSLYANKQWASPDQPGYFTLGLSEVE